MLGVDPDERPAALMRLGVDGLSLGPQSRGRDVLTRTLLSLHVPIASVAVADTPRLCAHDRAEQSEAVARARIEVDRANRLECAHLVLDLGALPPTVPRVSDLIEAFSRGRLAAEDRAAFVRARQVHRAPAMDSVRRSLDALLPLAQRSGCAIALLPAATGDALGFPGEFDELRRDYAGAPLCRWRAVDREHGLFTLGLIQPDARGSAAGADLADAVGVLLGLPPGCGEVDWKLALSGLDAAPRVIVAPLAREPELRKAVAWLKEA